MCGGLALRDTVDVPVKWYVLIFRKTPFGVYRHKVVPSDYFPLVPPV